jgi:hypothetical protein
MKSIQRVLTLLSITAFIFGCGGGMTQVGSSDEPGWIGEPPTLCGVGNQKIRSTAGNATKFARAKARDELSRKMETKVGNMIKSYLSEGGTGDGDFSEELVGDVSKQVSKTTLNGTSQKKRFIMRDGDIREVYVLVCLEPGSMDKAMDEMKQLNAKQRAALTKRAAKMQMELKDELKNY